MKPMQTKAHATAAAAVAAAAFLFSALASTAGNIAPQSNDGRGLITMPGLLRSGSGEQWGAANLIVFGPGWAYSAQDYALGNIRKWSEGGAVHVRGDMRAGSRPLKIEEVARMGKRPDGTDAMRVTWRIRSADGEPLQLERAFIQLPVGVREFAGGGLDVDGARVFDLPATYSRDTAERYRAGKDFVLSGPDVKLRVTGDYLDVALWDGRGDNNKQCYALRLQFPDAKSATETEVDFWLSGSNVGFTVRRDPHWTPLSWGFPRDVRPGSILDFGAVLPADAPAGKHGFTRVSKDGHFVFENAPDKQVRLIGGNLCFDANFLDDGEAEKAVRDFRAMGWNAIRFHHIDVTVTKDEWSRLWDRDTMPELDPAKLDKLDKLIAECKKAGIYMTFDLYAMGSLGSCEGFGKPLNSHTAKAVVPIHKPAEDQWFRRAMEYFDHVNPYTGVAWKDEPAITMVTLLNEDSIVSVWRGAAEMYLEKYNEWAKAKGCPEAKDASAVKDMEEFAEFLIATKAEANRRMAGRLRDAGVKTLITGGNWWNNMQQAYEREALDIVDNHMYDDHPQEGAYQGNPVHLNQSANIKPGHPTYVTPIMMGPSRYLGKPFTVSEYNFCYPNMYRAGGGLMMGAYASLQDWDGLYRFAWSHTRNNMFETRRGQGFDIVTDPVSQLTERQIALLFARRDVSPAEKVYGYAVKRGEAFRGGLGDMWSRNLFPHEFTQLGFTSRVGSFVADESEGPPIPCDKVFSGANGAELPQFNPDAQSDTGEVKFDTRAGTLSVSTPRTAGVCSFSNGAAKAGPLSVFGSTAFCSVSASAMDGMALEDSSRVLVMHITDVLNTNEEFSDGTRKYMQGLGELPYLVRTGSADVALRSNVPGLALHAVASDGSRVAEIPLKYEDGVYRFKLEIRPGDENATMMYELAE